MSKAQFDKAFKEFLENNEEVHELAPETFFGVLAEIERERTLKTIELEARIVEGQLRFQPSPDISVHDNEIVLGDQRIVVTVL